MKNKSSIDHQLTPSYSNAQWLLRTYLTDPDRILHSETVARIAFDTAKKIQKKHPSLNINPEKVRIAGLLHDIGYADPTGHHEMNSVKILKKYGWDEIAEIVLHGYVYEMHLMEGIEEERYRPTSIENKIVIFADLVCDRNHEIAEVQERINEVKQRKQKDTKRIQALEMAETRLLLIELEIVTLL
jgi:putative nucleotidyltransferase with HDIG domain